MNFLQLAEQIEPPKESIPANSRCLLLAFVASSAHPNRRTRQQEQASDLRQVASAVVPELVASWLEVLVVAEARTFAAAAPELPKAPKADCRHPVRQQR